LSAFFIFYPILGLFSGFLAGLLGIGGGLVIVPCLLVLFSHEGLRATVITHSAIATSLATVLVTSLIASISHHRHGTVEWFIFKKMAPGLLCGAIAGAIITSYLPGEILRVIFGLFALAIAVQMVLGLQPPVHGFTPGTSELTTISLAIGLTSALVGIGGGTMTVPFLRWSNIIMNRAVATSSACGFPIAVGACIGFSLVSKIDAGGVFVINMIYWPAAIGIALASVVAVPFGAYFTHRINTLVLTRTFALALAFVGLRLLF
jgi:uncharacterized protein